MTKHAGKPPDKAGASSVEPRVEIDSEVTRNIRQHARAHSKTEVCGVLIGEFENGTIDIRASIEGVNAEQAGTHVTFTQDAWEAIYRVKDDLYPDARIVGWYHSHPGFGVFLSDHDLFIQQNFFSSPGQVAWVYDPHTDEEGCFGWVGGEIHRLAELSIMDRNGDGVEHTPKRSGAGHSSLDDDEEESVAAASSGRPAPTPAWIRWSGIFLTHVSVLLAGFAIAYFLFPRYLAMMVDPLTGEHVLCDVRSEQCMAVPDSLPGPAGPMPPPATQPSSSTPPASPSTPPPTQPQAPAQPPAPAQPSSQGSHK
jgi:proteasome lid subunit RPN8/RPN11